MTKTYILGFLILFIIITYVKSDRQSFEDAENEIKSIETKLRDKSLLEDDAITSKFINKMGRRAEIQNKLKHSISTNWRNQGKTNNKNIKLLKQFRSFSPGGKSKRMGKKRTMLMKKRHNLLEQLKSDKFENTQDRKRVEKQLELINKKLQKISVRNFIRKSLKKTDIGKGSKITFKDANHPMEKSLGDKTKLLVGDVVMLMPSMQADLGINSIEMKIDNEVNDSNKSISLNDKRNVLLTKHNTLYQNKTSAYMKKNDFTEKKKVCNGKCEQLCIDGHCFCRNGYILMDDKVTCLDINECSFHNGYCQHNCTNLVGSHECSCLPGYQLDVKFRRTCLDINECHANNGHGDCQDKCYNTIGSYYCTCENLNGTILSSDGKHCDTVDECAEGKSGCSHSCINYYNGYVCDCPQGWKLGKDRKTCEDIDECQEEEIKQKCVICKNIPGSYICPIKVDNLLKDQPNIVCPPLHPPEIGYFDCNRTNSIKYKEYRRELLINSVGAICELVCPIGDSKMVYCSETGNWKSFKNTTIEC